MLNNLPVCPVCSAEVTRYEALPEIGEKRCRQAVFDCGAALVSRRELRSPPHGELLPWSDPKLEGKCSNAQKVALELLAIRKMQAAQVDALIPHDKYKGQHPSAAPGYDPERD